MQNNDLDFKKGKSNSLKTGNYITASHGVYIASILKFGFD